MVSQIKENAPTNAILALCGNKSDLINSRKISKEVGKDMADKNGMLFYECSALSGQNIENIVNDINSVLIERTNRPCSFHVCFINKLPVKNIYFNYTFVDLDYMPFFFSYANDSLSCILYLFIVDN